MSRNKALVMAGAAGKEPEVNQVLHRFGFDPADLVQTAAEVLQRVRQQRYDLLILAVDEMDPAQLAAVERELRREPGMNAIATAARTDPELILNAMRSGLHEFLVRPPAIADLTAALERMTRRSPSTSKRGSIVSLYSAKGGVGVTSVAVNLAFQLASSQTKFRVALADFVVGVGDVRMLLNLKSTYDISDLVARRDRVDADVLFSLLTQRGKVWVLPSSDKMDGIDLDAAAANAILSQLKANFGLTVLDCEDHLSEHTIAALDASDRVILVTQLTIPALRSTQRTLQLFGRLGYSDEKAVIVVNRFNSADTVSLSDAATVLERPITATLSNDFAACSKALNRGIPVMEAAPNSPLAGDYARLATKLIAALGGEDQKPAAPVATPARGQAAASRR
jgi:pilus assembly protein CpaE